MESPPRTKSVGSVIHNLLGRPTGNPRQSSGSSSNNPASSATATAAVNEEEEEPSTEFKTDDDQSTARKKKVHEALGILGTDERRAN